MGIQVPKELLFDGAQLSIDFVHEAIENRTIDIIRIEGNRPGFLSLANIILHFINAVEEELDLHKLPFVKSSIEVKLQLVREPLEGHDGIVKQTGNLAFAWQVYEMDCPVIAQVMHGLDQWWSHLHLDDKVPMNAISVYCEVV